MGPFFTLFKTPVTNPRTLLKNPFPPPGAAIHTGSWNACLKPLATTQNVDEPSKVLKLLLGSDGGPALGRSSAPPAGGDWKLTSYPWSCE